MIEIHMQVSDQLGQRLQQMSRWLGTVLELSLAGLKTPAVRTAAEIIEFLAANPTSLEVMNYHVSSRAQERLERLLVLNTAGMLSAEEQAEVDESEMIEHILIMLKARAKEQAGEDAFGNT